MPIEREKPSGRFRQDRLGVINLTKPVVPFLSLSLGAANMSTPAESSVRFEFGIRGGVKVFPKPRWGILFHIEYLPMVMQAEVQRLVCSGGCILVVKGRLASQFTVGAGPIFRF